MDLPLLQLQQNTFQMPTLLLADVQNYISNNPHLKDFCKKGTLPILFNFVPPPSIIFIRTDFQNINELKMKRLRNSIKTPNQPLKLVEKTRSRTKSRTPRQVL